MKIYLDKRIIITLLIVFVVITGLVGYSFINSDVSSTTSLSVSKYDCSNSNDLYELLACQAVPDNVKSKYVSSSTGINFSQMSSNTNGKGVYTLASTIGDTYPIHYFRGDVDNNYATFGGYCWRIVRTTSDGGVKLIYDGVPVVGQGCTATGANTTIGSSKYNTYAESFAYMGYMYGDVYDFHSLNKNDTFKYGSSFSFVDVDSNVSGDGTYTLTNQISSIDNTHHYTCLNTTGTCSSIAYVYYMDDTYIFYILIKDGKSIENAISEMKTNTNDSTIKGVVDDWFSSELSIYTPYMNDSIWCNDRSENTNTSYAGKFNSGWNSNGGLLNTYYWTQGYVRRGHSFQPIVDSCPNKNDAFTVSDTTNGNGKLLHPVGLLTSDEVMMAGGANLDVLNNYYLNVGVEYWLMNPIHHTDTLVTESRVMDNGRLSSNSASNSLGVRPAITSKSLSIMSGEGTMVSPYVIRTGKHSG